MNSANNLYQQNELVFNFVYRDEMSPNRRPLPCRLFAVVNFARNPATSRHLLRTACLFFVPMPEKQQ